MSRDAILFLVAAGLLLALVIRRAILAEGRSPVNDKSVPRGFVGYISGVGSARTRNPLDPKDSDESGAA